MLTGRVPNSPPVPSNLAAPHVPVQSNRPVHNLNQNSTTKDRLRTAWNGVQLLLKKVEVSLSGTPFQTPFAAVNVLIELGNVCPYLHLYATCADNYHRLLSTTRTPWGNW